MLIGISWPVQNQEINSLYERHPSTCWTFSCSSPRNKKNQPTKQTKAMQLHLGCAILYWKRDIRTRTSSEAVCSQSCLSGNYHPACTRGSKDTNGLQTLLGKKGGATVRADQVYDSVAAALRIKKEGTPSTADLYCGQTPLPSQS